jgi:hypothetical protein
MYKKFDKKNLGKTLQTMRHFFGRFSRLELDEKNRFLMRREILRFESWLYIF